MTKFTKVTILSLCTFALACAAMLTPGVAKLPSNPYDGNLTVAHGPYLPPDPWDGDLTLAIGPLLPPDPWDGDLTVAHGPYLPPDPWDGDGILTVA